MGRVILHSDANSFYPSVEIQLNPRLRNQPVAVCGSVEERHGIVLSANPAAKWYQIKVGDAVWQALEKCHNLVVLPPNMERYSRASRYLRSIYGRFTDIVIPYGLDECWLDVTGLAQNVVVGEMLANKIRETVKREIGITVSIGVADNYIFSKLGSDLRKPDFTNVISPDNYKDVAWPLPASDLLFVGRSTKEKLSAHGIRTIGQLANTNPETLKRRLGVRGLDLWQFANGIDHSLVKYTRDHGPDKSVGNSFTPPRDLICYQDIWTQVMVLAEGISERMRNKKVRGYTIKAFIRYSDLYGMERQRTLAYPVSTAKIIAKNAMQIIEKNRNPAEPVRKVGISVSNLIWADTTQLSLLPEIQAEQRQEDLEAEVQDLRKRYGHFSVERAMMLVNRDLSRIDMRDNNSAQSLAFYRG